MGKIFGTVFYSLFALSAGMATYSIAHGNPLATALFSTAAGTSYIMGRYELEEMYSGNGPSYLRDVL